MPPPLCIYMPPPPYIYAVIAGFLCFVASVLYVICSGFIRHGSGSFEQLMFYAYVLLSFVLIFTLCPWASFWFFFVRSRFVLCLCPFCLFYIYMMSFCLFYKYMSPPLYIYAAAAIYICRHRYIYIYIPRYAALI